MHPLETYLREMRDIRSTGAGVAETSYYGPLGNLLNEVGRGLRPRVRTVFQLANRGAGLPDAGFFTSRQFQRRADDEPLPGQLPERGVLEVKAPADDVLSVARSDQIARYLKSYGMVLVTNYRAFVLVGRNGEGLPDPLESYSLAASELDFFSLALHPRDALREHGERLLEYLKRALLLAAPLEDPRDVAFFLASYARDARSRLEGVELPALSDVRGALESALGLSFRESEGEHFFRSTLVQTLFYGIFSSWVLWHEERPYRRDSFEWRQAAWYLRVPMIRALFERVASPTHLRPLDLVEPLDWAEAALGRVNRSVFFTRFVEEHAVQYFYEPFLEAFDPVLRRKYGVWYTPPEVVRYMVARVDQVLREELMLPLGLADPTVYVLDPCCGTGAYLIEVLRQIAATLEAQGGDALLAADVKAAALDRVFGFEVLPAPFVVAHLQIGLLLHKLGVPLSPARSERAEVFLTNSLTGWEAPEEDPKNRLRQFELAFPEIARERDAANEVKRSKPILVILGNPPYDGFSGIAMGEERQLSAAYRTTVRAPTPQGQGLNELYVRFFRMAERKIVEGTGRGIVCFISNYSWLDGLSHTGMREHYLEAFDRLWIDNLNGDKYKTGKVTPEGSPDPSVFSTEWNREGIQVGTAVALLLRKQEHQRATEVSYREFWGNTKREELLDAISSTDPPYEQLEPIAELGFPFLPVSHVSAYLSWPKLPELFPDSFPGVKTSRDELLVDIDRHRLEERMQKYFDPNVSHEEMGRICPAALKSTRKFQPKKVRAALQAVGFAAGSIIRYLYRPFDLRWLFWISSSSLLDRERADYHKQIFEGNCWISAGQRNRKENFYQPQFTRQLADHHIVESNVGMFPLYQQTPKVGALRTEPNLTTLGGQYLASVSGEPAALFFHAIAILHSPAYQRENRGALRQDWPRVPLPESGRALDTSAALGRALADLLDPEANVPGVTTSRIRQELKALGRITATPGRQLDAEEDLAIKAGWGYRGAGGVTMPGQGRVMERPYSEEEKVLFALGAAELGIAGDVLQDLLGPTTFDLYLNDVAFWANVPARAWSYTLGGYPVIKKWLSYREQELLGRPLSVSEAREVSGMVRRIAAILLLSPHLDANYRTVVASLSTLPL